MNLTKEECRVVANAICIDVAEDIMDMNDSIISIRNKIAVEHPDLLYLLCFPTCYNLPEINSINE